MAGVKQTVTINDVLLDFAGLFGEKQATETPVEPLLAVGKYKDINEPEKPVERLIEGLEGQQAKQLYIQTQREQEAAKRSLEIYQGYQQNIKTSSQLQTEILKGLKAGEDVYSLFLKAAKAISLMTSNALFYNQTEADLIAIYGAGLQEKAPLKKRLQDTQKRLQRLLEAEQRETLPDDKERIRAAIKAHREAIETLEKTIEQ